MNNGLVEPAFANRLAHHFPRTSARLETRIRQQLGTICEPHTLGLLFWQLEWARTARTNAERLSERHKSQNLSTGARDFPGLS